jgi:hypothetical protein
MITDRECEQEEHEAECRARDIEQGITALEEEEE